MSNATGRAADRFTTIRRLLDRHIDVVHEDNPVTVKTHIIGPLKDANAADVADLCVRYTDEHDVLDAAIQPIYGRPRRFGGPGGFGGNASSTPGGAHGRLCDRRR